MKVLHVFYEFPSINQLYNSKLIKRLELSDVKCSVIIFSKKVKSTEFNIKSVSYNGIKWPVYILKCLQYYNLFKKYKQVTNLNYKRAISYFGRFSVLLKINPDIVHVHHIQLLQASFLNFLNVCEFKKIVSLRGSDLLVRPNRSNNDRMFLVNVVQSVKNVHLVSNHLKERLQLLKPKGINCFVIHRSAETDNNIILEKYSSKVPMILTVGRIHWTKGYNIALEALNLLKSSGVKFSYHICGGYTLSDKDELNYWINRYNLEENIVFHGHSSSEEIDKLMSSSNIYLQSSLSEGVPNTLLRAIKNRIPTVTTNAGGISEIFQNEIDGFMVESGNAEFLFLKLKELILNKELQEKIKNTKNLSVSNYKQEMILYKQMYDQVSAI